MTKTFNADSVAREVRAHAADAVGEIASDMLNPRSGFLDDKWEKRIKKAKKSGVRDVLGWLADELYNDPATLSDLMGDRIYEAVNGDREKYEEVLKALETNAFPGMKKAVAMLRKV